MEEKFLLKEVRKEVKKKTDNRFVMNKKEKKPFLKEEKTEEDFYSKKKRVANVILPDIEG
ncbi:hypothetical protein [Clostridium formicaceticum]|uniref:Uncharacterized protein n=1 Tax=Clostridium formicaceticum TaxID=1497 RepID=A0AAC9RHS6_9CLOT|nr:hypothetical protein [Clostridium formicaceticum]AOY75957.1 hypothetical protein BJL90_08635 [Clostridium formicaceticum]ARE86306.1 hypothetical protein CLFO_06280 [Clostridium formicaceticum]